MATQIYYKQPKYQQNKEQVIKMDWVNQICKINNKFKFQLFGRNVQNLDKCYSQIGQFDAGNTGVMSDHAFNLFLNSFGVFLSTQEIRTIKEGFSTNGRIDYAGFIQNVRQDISEKRLATIDHIWEELSNGEIINIDELLSKFDANKHPHCRCMVKSPEKILHEFEGAIRKRSADGRNLTNTEFKEFYHDVNACIPVEREEYFVDILIHSYHLMDNRVTLDRLKQLQVTVYEKVRQKTYFKKDEGDKGKAGFRFFDMEDKGIVDFQRFVSTLERLGCKFTDKENKALYLKHAGSDGILTYQEMCGLLFEMGSGLKDNSNPIFQLAKNATGMITTQGMSKKMI